MEFDELVDEPNYIRIVFRFPSVMNKIVTGLRLTPHQLFSLSLLSPFKNGPARARGSRCGSRGRRAGATYVFVAVSASREVTTIHSGWQTTFLAYSGGSLILFSLLNLYCRYNFLGGHKVSLELYQKSCFIFHFTSNLFRKISK